MGIPHKFAALCVLVAFFASVTSCKKLEIASIRPEKGRDGAVVRILTSTGYLSKSVVRDFTWETGISVEKHEFSTTEEMVAQLRAYPHRYDLVAVEASSVSRLAKQKLLRRLDLQKLPAIDELMPEVLQNLSEEVSSYSIPYHWGTTIVAYRSDKIASPEKSFEMLFEPQMKGKVLLLDNPFECLGVIHRMSGKSINAYSEEDIDLASDRLNELVEKCELRFASQDIVKKSLLEGEYWAGLCYSGECVRMAERDSRISYFLPKEGAGMWLDVFAMSRDAENVDEVYSFLSYLMRPACIAKSSEELKYPNPYPASWDNVDAAMLDKELLWPGEEELKHYELFGPRPAQQFSQISRRFSEVTRGRLLRVSQAQKFSIRTRQENGNPTSQSEQ
ncbi:MAG: hypothetical protein CMO55_15705 [Verrucomicrobiales bacterium]|nr:hypothetical protein [Verrucomicrobiales bacterium]